MKPNVLNYEPEEALFVPDEDPMLFFRIIIEQAEDLLKQKGRIYFEINENMEEKLKELLRAKPDAEYSFKHDLNGKLRMLRISF